MFAFFPLYIAYTHSWLIQFHTFSLLLSSEPLSTHSMKSLHSNKGSITHHCLVVFLRLLPLLIINLLTLCMVHISPPMNLAIYLVHLPHLIKKVFSKEIIFCLDMHATKRRDVSKQYFIKWVKIIKMEIHFKNKYMNEGIKRLLCFISWKKI